VKVLITALTLFLVATAAAAENPSPLYLVVMEPGGGPPPDVAGGTVEYQQGQMLALRLPEQAVEGLRHNPRVRYIQRVVSASEEVQAPVRTVETTGDLRPRTEMASPWTTGTYSYDGSGNITSIGPNSDAKTNVYRYDTIGRLSTATIHTPSTPSSAAVAHSESYGYDRYGNRTGITTDGVPIALPADAATNRLVASLGVTYDAVGNVKTDPSGSNYSYDAANMLRQRGGTAYLYTADDERIATVSGTSGARWTLRNLEGKVVREYDSFGPTTGMEYFLWTEDFFHAGSQLVASQRETAEGGRRHYHLDHLGTPLFATNASGSRVSSHAYYPFGVEATSILQERNRGFDREQPLRYTGHERDGLDSSIAEHDDYVDYMHARYYRAGWGRFLSVDPHGFWELQDGDEDDQRRFQQYLAQPQVWNRYVYANNNPIKNIDPDGKEATLALGGAWALSGSGTAAGTAGAATATGGAVIGASAAGAFAVGWGIGSLINEIPGVSSTVTKGFTALLDNTIYMAENNRQRQTRVSSLIAIAAVHIGKINSAGGPEKDPDYNHHKKEIKAFLEKARDVAKRLPKKAQEEAMRQIRDIASKVGLEM